VYKNHTISLPLLAFGPKGTHRLVNIILMLVDVSPQAYNLWLFDNCAVEGGVA
jgi:hypothetical protein